MIIVQITGGETKIPTSIGGGVETFIFNLSKELSKMGHDVTILDRKYSPSDRNVEYVEGVKIVRLKAKVFNGFNPTINFVLNQAAFAFKVKKHIKITENIDIINVHYSVLGIILVMLNKSIRRKLVYTSHALRREKASPDLVDRMALALENQLVKVTKKTMIANEIVSEKLARQAGVKPEKVRVVPIGVDIEQYNPDLDVKDVRQKYSLEGKANILFVGRTCFEKGVEYLVKAANIVVNQAGESNIQFLIVGPAEQFGTGVKTQSPYTSRITGLIEDFGLQESIRFTGIVPVDDLRKLYAACDVVVIPSVVDLDPQVQIEAMASGKPVIGTRVGTMPRRIKDGQSGFIIDPADEKQLAEKIKFLLDNPTERKKMGTFARKLVEEEYSAEKMAARMLEVFEDATTSPR